MNIPEKEIWIPRRLRFSFGEPIVELAIIQPPTAGFLSDDSFQESSNSFNIPLADINIDLDHYAPDGLIFHFPRSGSTAIAMALGDFPECSCYFEPETLNQLFVHRVLKGDIETSWVKVLVALLVRSIRSAHPKAFLKLSSWLCLFVKEFRTIFPKAPFVFVYPGSSGGASPN